jgi:hypothetical protein
MLVDGGARAQPRRTSLALYAMVRALEFSGNAAALAARAPGSAAPSWLKTALAWRHWDTAAFTACCAEIMHSWFYGRHRLPRAYVRWISAVASIDERLVEMLARFRRGDLRYGGGRSPLLAAYCRDHGLPSRWADCEVWLPPRAVHPRSGSSSARHVLRTWLRTLRTVAWLYGPVHVIPLLLFRPRAVAAAPLASAARVGQAVASSSAFLATFVASLWAFICGGRALLRRRRDESTGVLAGCALCGLSVLIEKKKRRWDLALYVAPRAAHSLWRRAVDARVLGVRDVPGGEVAVFAAAMAVIMHHYEHAPENVRPSVHRLGLWLFG